VITLADGEIGFDGKVSSADEVLALMRSV